ncbi:MAG: DUF2240 family protein [Candidatus Thermoplasmatota archaeon]|nr:DUF2240 family protein [Candidatus Thermoplasmatota archaeon]
MDSEEKIIIAFIFNRSGKTGLPEAEFYLPLAMELGWLSTKEAQEFVKNALKQGLLVRKDELLQPNFSVTNVTIPLGFSPSKQLFTKTSEAHPERTLLQKIIDHICETTHQSHHEIEQEIATEEKEKNILPEVAAVIIAVKHHVDITEWYTDVDYALFQRK